jgi:hypothetical protein
MSKSIFYGKTQGKIDLKLTDNQLNKEIDNLSINQNYLIDLFNNRKDQIQNELIMMECECNPTLFKKEFKGHLF